MLGQVLVVLTVAACALGASLPLRRAPHTGPARGAAVWGGRIYGGHDATRGEFPYMVSLKIVSSGTQLHSCGGAIISSNAVLTAAHCAANNPHYIAVAGEHDLSKDEGSEQQIPVAQQIVHPSYPGGDVVAPYDIAVFTLQSALTLNSFVQVISLPTAGSIPAGGSTAVVSGWGATEHARAADILQTGEVSVIDYETCRQNLGTWADSFTDEMICTVSISDGIHICYGDSGGPLAQNGELIGVVSWGTGNLCSGPEGQSVYSRVSAAIDFITANADV